MAERDDPVVGGKVSVSLVAFFALLLTEYGVLARRTATERLAGRWRLGRTLIRLVIWSLTWVLSDRGPATTVLFVAAFLVGEGSVVWLRRTMRIDIKEGRAHGRPTTHFIPLLAAIVTSALLLGAERIGFADPQLRRLAPLAWGAAIVGLWTWATMVTVSVVDLARPDLVRDDGPHRMGPGEVIGILERLVAFVLIVSGALPTIGFVIAAKAAARFPLFKEKAFAEYFLIGTLTSVGLALLFGLMMAAIRGP
jgi:hypothetical protein